MQQSFYFWTAIATIAAKYGKDQKGNREDIALLKRPESCKFWEIHKPQTACQVQAQGGTNTVPLYCIFHFE